MKHRAHKLVALEMQFGGEWRATLRAADGHTRYYAYKFGKVDRSLPLNFYLKILIRPENEDLGARK